MSGHGKGSDVTGTDMTGYTVLSPLVKNKIK